jgi:hypothetical protein
MERLQRTAIFWHGPTLRDAFVRSEAPTATSAEWPRDPGTALVETPAGAVALLNDAAMAVVGGFDGSRSTIEWRTSAPWRSPMPTGT